MDEALARWPEQFARASTDRRSSTLLRTGRRAVVMTMAAGHGVIDVFVPAGTGTLTTTAGADPLGKLCVSVWPWREVARPCKTTLENDGPRRLPFDGGLHRARRVPG